MEKVVYRGPADIRVLNKADMTRLGAADDVDFSKTTFKRGEAVAVPEAVSELLLSHRAFAKQFQLDKPRAPELKVPAAAKK